MNGFLFLLYCTEILGAVLCENGSLIESPDLKNATDHLSSTKTSLTVLSSVSNSMTEVSSSMSTRSPTTVAHLSSSPSTSPSPGSQPTTPNGMLYRKECLPVFMVTGGLIIACTILLVSTLLLAWKVCQLSRRIKALSSNADLISNSDYWMGTAEKNKSKPETEPKETSVLMADFSQTQQETGNGTTKEEGGTVNKDNKKEVGDATNSEDASTTPEASAENSSSSKPQETTQPTKSVAASTSEGTEAPKDVV